MFHTAGRTRYNEIRDAVRAEPSRTLDRLQELRLVERLLPVGDDPGRSRRRRYRVADNFLAFWLGLVEPYQAEIDRGLGATILPVVVDSLDDHMGRIGRPDGHGGRRLLVHLAHPFGPAAVVGTTEAEVPPIELVEWVPSPCWSRAAGCPDEPLVVIVPRIRSEKGGRAHETRSSANLRGVWSTATGGQ